MSATAERNLRLTLIAFPIALLLFVVFALILRSQRRAAGSLRRAELDRLERAALTDHLTGMRNHRAFQEDLARALDRRARGADAPLTLVILDMDGLKQVNDALGHQAGDEQLRALAACIAETLRSTDAGYRVGGDEFALVLDGETAVGALRLVQRLQAELSGTSREMGPRATAGVAETHGPLTKDELIRRADLALYDAKRSHRPARLYADDLDRAADAPAPAGGGRHLEMLARALARAVDTRDSATRSHCETVSEITGLLAEELGLPGERVARLRIAGLLHDVGKIGIPDDILLKPASLTADEFEVMKSHATLGHGILAAAGLEPEAHWVLHHHERIDGRGYPAGLTGHDIPLESRILLVADAYEAMTAERPYRPARPEHEALEELELYAGAQFDRRCVAALRRVLRRDRTPVGA